MAYLYAGLGVAMLAATMAIFEFGISLSGSQRSLLPPPRGTEKQRLDAILFDQLWLKLLNDEVALSVIGKVSSQTLCERLMCRISQSAPCCVEDDSENCKVIKIECPDCRSIYSKGYDSLSNFAYPASSDANTSLPAACELSNEEHRVLVVPQDAKSPSPYGFYSCLTTNSPLCSFERK